MKDSSRLEAFLAKHPNCCPLCGWHISAHADTGYGPDCPWGISPANDAGELPGQKETCNEG